MPTEHKRKEFDAIIKPLPTSRIIYLGTPQCEMSLYNNLPERGYRMRIWPAEFPTEEAVVKYKGRLAPYIEKLLESGAKAGDPTEPVRFSLGDLDERRLSYGKAGYALQFLLDTSLSDADKYPLKLSDLIVMGLDMRKGPSDITWASGPDQVISGLPVIGLTGDRYYRPMWVSKEFQDYTGRMMFIDPSGRGKDELGYAVTYFLNGNVFLMEVGGFKHGYEDKTLESLAQIAKRHKVNLVRSESNFGDGMFEKLLEPVMKRVYPVTVEGIRHSGQKELRIIDCLEPMMTQHRLVVHEDVIRKDYESTEQDPKYSLFYQATRITSQRGALAHDDRLEAVYGAVNYWVEFMNQDSQEELKNLKDEAWEREIEKIEENLGMQRGHKENLWAKYL